MGKNLAIALISSMIVVILGGMTSLALSSDDLTDQQKQLEIQKLVDNHRSSLPTELVLAIICQEGGEGAFQIDGWDYNSFYSQNDGPWAQPTNGDGIMQVTTASGHHEKCGPYTHDQSGYDNAINDGCDYLLEVYGTYDTYVQTALHYNTGPNTLYIYLGRNWGDRNYLSNVAAHLSSFVPNTYGFQNQDLVESLNQGQSILDDYLYNRGIETGQSLDYYSQYQVQLDNDLNNILDSDSANLQTDLITLTLYVHEGSASGPVIPGALITGNDGSGNSFQQTTDNSGYVIIEGDPGTWSFSVSAAGYETNNWDQDITEDDIKDAFLQQEQDQDITLTLYIHDGSASGPIIPDAQVTGWDGSGNSFEQTSSSSGYVTIAGFPGIWSFSVSADGYETNSWSQEITETDTKDAFLQEEQQYSQNSVIGKWDMQVESEFVDTDDGSPRLSRSHSIIEFHKDGTFSSHSTEHESLDENGAWVEAEMLELQEEPQVDGEWTQYEDTVRLQYYPWERTYEYDGGGYGKVWQSEGGTGELIVDGDSMSGIVTHMNHYEDHWPDESPIYRDESCSASYTGRRIDTLVIPDMP